MSKLIFWIKLKWIILKECILHFNKTSIITIRNNKIIKIERE